MAVDVGGRLQFLEVVHTTLRSDIVLWSIKDQKIILVELTAPWEEGRGPPEEGLEVLVLSPGLQGQGLASVALPCGDWM